MNLAVTFTLMLLSYMSGCSVGNKEIKLLYGDHEYIKTTQAYYKFHSPSTWINAKQKCESECSSLWYPKNYDEVKAVVSVFRKTNKFDSVYIGISDIAAEGTFITIDGIPVSQVYNNWQLGQPDNYKNEDCVILSPGRVLNDTACSDEYNFICKLNETCAQEAKTNCDVSDLDVDDINVIHRADGSIDTIHAHYKFHSPSTWTDAKKICESESSSFWYPKSEKEMRSVLSLFKETNPDFEWIYVGISDRDTEGKFITIDGIPVNEIYNNWGDHQPDNYNGAEDCVHLAHNFYLNDIGCDSKYSFICKKPKKSTPKYNTTCDITNLDSKKDVKVFYKDFQYVNQTQAYYKFNSPSTWTDAKRKCDSEGSSFWYPKNYDEARAVLSLFKETQNFAGLYIGISDIVVDETFETTDGIAIVDVYDNWQEYEPNTVPGEEDCVHLSPDAILNGICCKKTYPFVCKKTKINEEDNNNNCDVSLDGTKDTALVHKGYQYIEKTEAYYKYYSPGKWADANRICESDDSSLWYPKNSDEAHAVLSLFSPTHTFDWLYIGISDIAVEGTFETVDGLPLTAVYNSWRSEQPDNYKGEENCVHIGADAVLNDIECWRTYPFVCKKTKSSKQSCNEQPDMKNLGYTYNEDEGKWYKFHKSAMNWTNAYKMCNEEQSYLAVINSNIELNYLLRLIKGPDYYVTQVIPKDTIHLGFHNRFGLGWQTIEGTKLDKNWYTRWAPGQPDGLTQAKEQNCGSMSYTGQLHDIGCDTESFFICEHDVDKHLSN